jgi:DNA-binding NtrC family response regulator
MVPAVVAKEKPRVLVVADDRAVLDRAAALLDMHAEVVTSPSPRRALELAEREAFDVVCADGDMLSMAAVELFRRMMGVLGHVGYVMLTSPAAYAATPADGRWHVVFKPLDAGKLSSAVLSLCRLAQMRRSVADLARLRAARG